MVLPVIVAYVRAFMQLLFAFFHYSTVTAPAKPIADILTAALLSAHAAPQP